MISNKISILFLFFATVFLTSCDLEELENQNRPELENFTINVLHPDVESLAIGLEAVMRDDISLHYETVSYLAREYYDLTNTDPRNTGEILKGPLDNNGFLTTRAYVAWYRIIKTANLLITATENAEPAFTEIEKNSYLGYANTIKAYALLMVANRQYTNGIRIDVADPDNLGPFLDYDDALIAIKSLLNDAYSDLNNSPSEFIFFLSDGFKGFETPLLFAKFNRAIAARVALYQKDKTEVLKLLDKSFFDLDEDVSLGVKHIFGLSGNNLSNGLFYEIRRGNNFVVHNSWLTDAEMGDTRVAEKAVLLSAAAEADGLTGTHQIAVYDSNVAPIYVIRNEELILMYAEANIGTNNVEAVRGINVVRNAAGLANYSGGMTDADLELELLNQRRYSLLGEGHRWIDLRRFNKLNDTDFLPLDRAGDMPIEAFPTPFNENQ